MKIAILSPFYPYRGGIAQFSTHLYKELSKNNEVKAFSFKKLYPDFLFPGKTQYVEDEDVVSVIDGERLLSSINPVSYKKTATEINKFAPDVLIVAYWMSFMAPALGSVCRFLKKDIKIVALVHNAVSHEKTIFETPLAHYFFFSCDAFIVMSKTVEKDLLRIRPNAKIFLQPHPIYDHYADKTDKRTAREKLNIDRDKRTLLFFGFIRDYKGLDILLEATKSLTDDYQLIVAGETYGSFDKYRKLIDESSIKNNIHVFDQYISDERVSIIFSASDVLVLPYRSATQSGVISTAYQLEMPVIATDVGAIGDTIRSAGTGIVVSDISPGGIADAVKQYFDEEKQSYYIGNIRLQKELLSWSSFAGNIMKFFMQEVV